MYTFSTSDFLKRLFGLHVVSGLFLWLAACQLTLAQQITTVAGTGVFGTAANQLTYSVGLFVDGAGYIYVPDQFSHRIQKFPPNSTAGTNATTVAGGNGEGDLANQLNRPVGVYVDEMGNIYVAEQNNHRIQKFPPNSTALTDGVTVAGGEYGSAANQLNQPFNLRVDGAGYIYVVDYGNHRIQKFPPNSTAGTNATTVAGTGVYGSDANQLANPQGVSLDGVGNIYVADTYNHRIQKFPTNSTAGVNGITVAGTGVQGTAADRLAYPTGLFIDGTGNIYVSDHDNQRVQKFPANSTQGAAGITVAGGNGVGVALNQLVGPYGLSVNGAGELYISDYSSRILKYSGPWGATILTQPVAGSSVSAGATVTAQVSATANVPITYQWYKDNALVSNQTSATLTLNNVQTSNAGSYSVVVSSGGVSLTSTAFTLGVAAPDLALLLYALPATLYGTTPISVVMDVVEVTGGATSGPITVVLAQDPAFTLSLPPNASIVGGRLVDNSVWSLSGGPSDGFYRLTTNQSIAAGDVLSVGLTGFMQPGTTKGSLSISAVIVGGSGGEVRIDNNSDADKIDYFNK